MDAKDIKESVKGSRATVVEIIGKTGMQSKLNYRLKRRYHLSQSPIGRWSKKNSYQKCYGSRQKRRHSWIDGMWKRSQKIAMI